MKYKIGFYYTEHGITYIEADSKEKAEDKIQSQLELNGLEGLDYETKDRDYEVVYSETTIAEEKKKQ